MNSWIVLRCRAPGLYWIIGENAQTMRMVKYILHELKKAGELGTLVDAVHHHLDLCFGGCENQSEIVTCVYNINLHWLHTMAHGGDSGYKQIKRRMFFCTNERDATILYPSSFVFYASYIDFWPRSLPYSAKTVPRLRAELLSITQMIPELVEQVISFVEIVSYCVECANGL
jgi:hypothetical protein